MRDRDTRAAVLAASRPMVVVDATEPGYPMLFVNPAFSALTGYPASELIGRNCRMLQGPDTDRQTVAAMRDALANHRSFKGEILNYRKDGTPFWNEITIDPIRDSSGRVRRYVGMPYDCTSKRAAMDGQAETQQQLTRVMENVPGYLSRRVLRPDGTIHLPFVSASLLRLLGLPDDGRPVYDQTCAFFHPADMEALMHAMLQSAAGMSTLRSEYRFVMPDGAEHWFRLVSTPVKDADGNIYWDGIAIEITDEKASLSRINYLSCHDRMTGLLNRDTFKTRLGDLTAAVVTGDKCAALLLVDLDQFQTVNEVWGQYLGDRALVEIGLRLTSFSQARHGTAARLGGDEFGILLRATADEAAVLAMAVALRAEIARPLHVEGQPMTIECCIGAATFPPLTEASQIAAGEEWTSELMHRAQLALSEAKREGAGSCNLYAPPQQDPLKTRLMLKHSLHQAINEEQFKLHYQPIVDLATAKIVGAEALVRWLHPELGLQRPDLFIPSAEASGLIVAVGAWVLKQAMQHSQDWRARGLRAPRISINVSSVQLQRPGFLDTVQDALAQTGASALDFELELTEGTLVEASVEVLDQLRDLKAMGFRLALDDFGVGHSTFKYLRDFPVDKLKIDKSFVQHLVVDSNDATIIRSMITLSRSLGIEVVAEGIETEMQRDFLLREGCRTGQGFLFGRPIPAEAFANALPRNGFVLGMDDVHAAARAMS